MTGSDESSAVVSHWIVNGPDTFPGTYKDVLAGLLWWWTWFSAAVGIAGGFIALAYIPEAHSHIGSIVFGAITASLWWVRIVEKIKQGRMRDE